jgi:hypothetical protein
MYSARMRKAGLVFLAGILIVALVWLIQWTMPDLVLVDFSFTFYRAARYLLRGENVYINVYPHPSNGREYPPFNPIWILYSVVPISGFPHSGAEALRFLFDLAAIPFLAFLCARWAGVESVSRIGLLALAPWHFMVLYSGQWSALALLGLFMCYWGTRRANVSVTAVGLLLVLAKPNVTVSVTLATLLFAWRRGILFKTVALFIALAAVFSLAQPTWMFDLLSLYLNRMVHPRLDDSMLLLPGYPWTQMVLLATSTLFLLTYFWKSREIQPPLWLWALLTCVSLVGALHTFTYDWLLLMLPLAWLLRQRYMIYVVGALYAYPFVWAFLLSLRIVLPAPTIIPFAILIALIIWRILATSTSVSPDPR